MFARTSTKKNFITVLCLKHRCSNARGMVLKHYQSSTSPVVSRWCSRSLWKFNYNSLSLVWYRVLQVRQDDFCSFQYGYAAFSQCLVTQVKLESLFIPAVESASGLFWVPRPTQVSLYSYHVARVPFSTCRKTHWECHTLLKTRPNKSYRRRRCFQRKIQAYSEKGKTPNAPDRSQTYDLPIGTSSFT